MLQIILNPELKGSLPDPNKKSPEPEPDHGSVWEQLISESEFTESNYSEQTQNGLINAFLFAYNNHIPLKIKVQDIHIALQLIISTFVNNNSEQSRDLFVTHSGKKTLTVENDALDFNTFGQMMRDSVKENIKDSKFIDLLDPKYSTTKPICQTVSNLLVLNTLKEYFSYDFVCCCGIPSVTMDGTQDDWLNLKTKYEEIKKIFYNYGTLELNDWFDCMDIVINLFIEMRMMGENGIVQATDDQKLLWERVITFVPIGSGGDTFLGGWVQILSPYSSKNQIKYIVKNLPCLDVKTMIPDKNVDYYQYQDILRRFYGGSSWGSLQSTMFLTPGTLNLWGIEYNIEIMAGFSPNVHVSMQDNHQYIVETNMMYTVMKEAETQRDEDEDPQFYENPETQRDEDEAEDEETCQKTSSKCVLC